MYLPTYYADYGNNVFCSMCHIAMRIKTMCFQYVFWDFISTVKYRIFWALCSLNKVTWALSLVSFVASNSPLHPR